STVSQVITDKHPNSEIANLFQEAEITIQSLLQVP
ncbi:TPA: DeoR family transcriptional regulator, partial [Streptococcus agalactiae]